MKTFFIILGVWILLWSIASVAVCAVDKRRARKNPRHRIRESTLLLLSALGGSVAMLLCMLIIRHKTKHAKFMLGIPVIILAQAALIALAVTVLLPALGVTW